MDCYTPDKCATLSTMNDATKETNDLLRVKLDEELREDIEKARRVTGIRSASDLVRYALRQVATGKSLLRRATSALRFNPNDRVLELRPPLGLRQDHQKLGIVTRRNSAEIKKEACPGIQRQLPPTRQLRGLVSDLLDMGAGRRGGHGEGGKSAIRGKRSTSSIMANPTGS